MLIIYSYTLDNEVIKWHFTFVVFSKKTYKASLIMRQIPIADTVQNTWSVLLSTIQVIKNKKSLENYHSQEDPKETRGLNVMCYPRWDPRTEKDH